MSERGLSIIVPALNEAGNIGQAYLDILAAVRRADLLGYHEVILVDDGSTDATGAQVDTLARQYISVRAVHHPRNLGLRAAYETGLKLARKSYVTWVPGDAEMAPESLAAIFRAVGTADLVVPYHGTPERRTWLRRLLTWGSTTQLNWLLGHNLRYYQGTVALRTSLARSLPRTESGFFFNAEMLCHALDRGLSYVEVPLVHQERQYGVSKAVSLKAIWRAQLLILRLFYRLRVRTACEALGFALEVGR